MSFARMIVPTLLFLKAFEYSWLFVTVTTSPGNAAAVNKSATAATRSH
jgi:hypothetical protein